MSIWSDLLLAFLHDPPDKALDIQRHESRARRYLEAALGWEPSRSEAKSSHADQLASATERLPMPAGDVPSRRVNLFGEDGGPFRLRHPLSASPHPGDWTGCQLDEASVIGCIRGVVDGLPDSEQPHRFLALWRLLPERLSANHEWYARLPADTRVPDHTIWHHMDITAGLCKAVEHGQPAFLSFSLGPVQEFIAAARSVRDLWTGSMILSWLTFQAMLPVIESLGPTALVYPSLRGVPLLDRWLRQMGMKYPELDSPPDQLKSPCLPNRFVAVVPGGPDGTRSRELAQACENAAREAWNRLCRSVHGALNDEFKRKIDPELYRGWDQAWQTQIENYFDVRTVVLAWRAAEDQDLVRLLSDTTSFDCAFSEAIKVRRLEKAIPQHESPGYSQCTSGQWQHRLELLARVMDAAKQVRHVPKANGAPHDGLTPPKCSLLGSFEQMGPAKLDESAKFWEQAAKVRVGGVRLKKRERLSALALVKRFAAPAFFAHELGIGDPQLLRWDDNATVAAAKWLERAQRNGIPQLDPEIIRTQEGNWSGQWLHLADKDDQDSDDACPLEVRELIQRAIAGTDLGRPPTYFAVLMMDGDNLGEWLRGERSPRLCEVLHPKIVQYYESLAAQGGPSDPSVVVNEAMQARRPVGPALHAALSEALANFALHSVPRIIAENFGTLIYAGGDDVLALLPTSTALCCARQLRLAFCQDWGYESPRERLFMGQRATLSGSLVVVHHKEDLRFALQRAREAEREAKQRGRDALMLSVCRRSGEHATALCPWNFVEIVEHWVDCFIHQASDRWAYRLRAEQTTLEGLNEPEILRAEIRRQINRAEHETKSLFGRGQSGQAAERLVNAFDVYRSAQRPRTDSDTTGASRFATSGEAFAHFVTLCQSASFLARGRDL